MPKKRIRITSGLFWDYRLAAKQSHLAMLPSNVDFPEKFMGQSIILALS